ncbi:MAG: MBL fold metallo-hydrolase [Planctomycetes bacterium]|nr:MBL fold metallo-hydrolase [Planctomycetota bacterium]
MRIQQYYLGCLAHASYLIFDEKSKTAVVVDPQRDIDHYVEDAEELGVSIDHVFLTHFHADFLAGHIELRERYGAQLYIGAEGNAEFDHLPVADGDTFEWGDLRIQVLETPGHTPESISLVVYDLAKDSSAPDAVLTGDCLFIGDVGRPDLLGSIGFKDTDLAAMLYDSLHEKLMKLPDATKVYPAHGAGSLCGKNLSTDTVSTIGEQRRSNYALQPMSKEEFVAMITKDQPHAPGYFVHDAILNRKERPTLDETLAKALVPVSIERLIDLQSRGEVQVLDVRDAEEFGAQHIAGSFNVALDGKYATWTGTLLDRERPIVIVGNPGEENEAAMRLGRIGFDHIEGYLEGGVNAGESQPEMMRSTPRVEAEELAAWMKSGDVVVVDVRNEREWETTHIEGTRNVPLHAIRERATELPRNRRLVLSCRTGYRSMAAAAVLEQEGFVDLVDLRGGIVEWQERGLPVVATACSGA